MVEIETAARWSLVAKDALRGAFSDDDDSSLSCGEITCVWMGCSSERDWVDAERFDR